MTGEYTPRALAAGFAGAGAESFSVFVLVFFVVASGLTTFLAVLALLALGAAPCDLMYFT